MSPGTHNIPITNYLAADLVAFAGTVERLEAALRSAINA